MKSPVLLAALLTCACAGEADLERHWPLDSPRTTIVVRCRPFRRGE